MNDGNDDLKTDDPIKEDTMRDHVNDWLAVILNFVLTIGLQLLAFVLFMGLLILFLSWAF